MTSISHIEEAMKTIFVQEADTVARETGCIRRQRAFRGSSLLQTLVFGFLQEASITLEGLASTAAVCEVQVTDTAVHKRFTPAAARFLHRVLEQMCCVMITADQPVPVRLLRRFRAVILEDSSTIVLPDEISELWKGCGGSQANTSAALKLHVRWELTSGELWGPVLTSGRQPDSTNALSQIEIPVGGLYIADLAYFSLKKIAQRHRQGSFTLTRLKSGIALFHRGGRTLNLEALLPANIGETRELPVLVGAGERVPMRLLMVRVPDEIAEKRREDLREDARRRGQNISEQTLARASWTLLITNVPAKRLSLPDALVLLRERWQIEILYRLWKQEGRVDQWHTDNPWRKLCELYAKLIGLILAQWQMVAFAWHDAQRSLSKLLDAVRKGAGGLLEALAGERRDLSSALRHIQRRMQSGCSMNRRHAHPNSAQLLEKGDVEWSLGP